MGHVAKWQQLCRPGVKLDIKKFSTSNSPTIISSLTLTLDWLVENWATLLRRGILLPVILSYFLKWKNFILNFFLFFLGHSWGIFLSLGIWPISAHDADSRLFPRSRETIEKFWVCQFTESQEVFSIFCQWFS